MDLLRTLRTYVFFFIISGFLLFHQSVFAALTSWNQSDWSGGAGQTSMGESTKYASSSDVSAGSTITISSNTQWYDTSWKYRQSVAITNASGSTLTDYQIPFFLDTATLIDAGKLNSDCSDLRVTNAGGTTMPYWIATSPSENTCDQTDTKIWLKVPSIPTSGTTIYAYYGNASAVAQSSGTNVFSVFADFTTGSSLPSGWVKTDVGTAGTATVGSGVLSVTNNNGVDIWENTYGGTHAYNNTKVSGAFIAETLITSQTNSDPWAKSGIMAINSVAAANDNGQAFMAITPGNGAIFQYQSMTGYNAANVNHQNGSYTTPTFLRLTKSSADAISGYFSMDGIDWTQQGVTTNPSGVSADQYVALFTTPHTALQSNTATFTFYYVRSYVATEPTAADPGSEQVAYGKSGILTSSIYDTGGNARFQELTYTAQTPANTAIRVKVRTSRSADMSGAPAFSSCSPVASGTDLSLTSCTHDEDRYVQYEVNLVSTDGVATPTFEDISIGYDVTPATTNTGSDPNGSPSACNGETPAGTPDLFQIDANSDSATMYFTPVSNASAYVISFSTTPNAEEHGATVTLGKEGVQQYRVAFLNPSTTYFFRVRAQNGCLAGGWSNIRSTRTTAKDGQDDTRSQAVLGFETEEPFTTDPTPTATPIPIPTAMPTTVPQQQTMVPVISPTEKSQSLSGGHSVVRNALGGVSQSIAFGSSVAQGVNRTVRKQISDLVFLFGNGMQHISHSVGYTIIAFGYGFIDEPTKIYDVQTRVLSPTSVKISWKTNQPANAKINYGTDKTYGKDVQTEKRETHHEFVLTDLTPNTTYYFEVMNHAKTYVYDANREFRTPIE